MEGMLEVAEGFNDARLAALGEMGAQRRRRAVGPEPKWRGRRTDPHEDDEDRELDDKASVRTVMVLFLSATLFLMHWRLSLSPQLEYLDKKRGHWLHPIKVALDTAACPECFDGSVMVPTLLAFYLWGRVIARVLGWALVLGALAAISYPPYLCWDHRLPYQYDWRAVCRSIRPQCQAAIDYREREGLEVGSDGHYAYLWKHGTTGSLTQPEIKHAKATRNWRHLDLQKDMLHSALELGFEMPWYGRLYNRVQISANGYIVLLPSPRRIDDDDDVDDDGPPVSADVLEATAAPDELGNFNSTYECCAPLDSIHTEHGEAVIAPYYTDLDPTIANKEGSNGVWAGELMSDYSFGIYFNRVAAANSPLEEGNRPNPRHTTSFQVILTAEGAVKMYYHEANASSHGRPKLERRGVFVGWRTPREQEEPEKTTAAASTGSRGGRRGGARLSSGGQLVTAATGNLTHSVDERIRRKAVLLNGCSIYAVHFSPQELFDRKIWPISVKPEDHQADRDTGGDDDPKLRDRAASGGGAPPSSFGGDGTKHRDPSAEWGDLAEGGDDAQSAEGARRRKEELTRLSEQEAMRRGEQEKDEI